MPYFEQTSKRKRNPAVDVPYACEHSDRDYGLFYFIVFISRES